MRTASRRDNNENEIAEALLKAGCSVSRINEEGIPDLLVGRANKNYLLEIKIKDGKLTPAQIKWHREWQGQKAKVETIEEAFEAVGL